jgi:DNA polymerase III delta prime subunit
MNYKLILNKSLLSNDAPNLILSGIDKIDKLSILMNYLNKIDNSSSLSLTKYDIKWISNPTYKIFDMNHIKYKQSKFVFEIIDEIISYKNYYTNSIRILVLTNFDNIPKQIQNKFRVIFEKFRVTTLFILITSHLTSIINPILSRFLLIRIPDTSRKEKRTISREYLKDLSYDKKSIVYDKIYNLANEKDIICYSQSNEGILLNHQTIYDKIYSKIISYVEINEKTIIEMKDLSYKIEKYNLKNCHKELFLLFINDLKLSDSIRFKILKLVSDCEYNYYKSFNTILSIENFIITLVHILNETTGSK